MLYKLLNWIDKIRWWAEGERGRRSEDCHLPKWCHGRLHVVLFSVLILFFVLVVGGLSPEKNSWTTPEDSYFSSPSTGNFGHSGQRCTSVHFTCCYQDYFSPMCVHCPTNSRNYNYCCGKTWTSSSSVHGNMALWIDYGLCTAASRLPTIQSHRHFWQNNRWKNLFLHQQWLVQWRDSNPAALFSWSGVIHHSLSLFNLFWLVFTSRHIPTCRTSSTCSPTRYCVWSGHFQQLTGDMSHASML